jgi:hypothetical protein
MKRLVLGFDSLNNSFGLCHYGNRQHSKRGGKGITGNRGCKNFAVLVSGQGC